MPMRSLLLGVVAVSALVLAGCTSPPPETPAKPTPTGGADAEPDRVIVVHVPANESAPPSKQVFPFAGKITAGAGGAGLGYVSPTGSSDTHFFHFAMNQGAVAVVAELKWDNPQNDLDLEVGTPDCDANAGTGHCGFADGGAAGAGDSPVKFTVTDAKALGTVGDWKLWVWGKSALNQDFQTVVSVFYGAPPDANYTALPK